MLIKVNKIKFIVFAFILLFIDPFIYADSLTLSDAEVKKLEQYFEVEDSNTHLVWQGDPLTIELPINKEKRIIFPDKILPDLKNALTTDQLRIMNDNQSLYLTALKPFSTTRMIVTLENSNQVLLIDLSTNSNANNNTLTIDVKQDQNKNEIIQSSSIDDNEIYSIHDEKKSNLEGDNAIELIRFAWRELYAPERLVNTSLPVSRVPMHTLPLLSSLIYGDKVYAHPISEWQYNETFVTAVELRNKYLHPTSINLAHDICGSWEEAALYPLSHLKPAGDKENDSTVLFLISKVPFNQAMEYCHGS